MTAAFAPFETLPRFRTIGPDRFSASCPTAAHLNGDRSRGLSGAIRGEKLLLKCWAGCSTADILAALGLDWQALFLDGGRTHRDPVAERKALAGEGLRQWREQELCRTAKELRERDVSVIRIDTAVADGSLTEDAAWNVLAVAYRGYADLEFTFQQLLHNENVFELWRESRPE